MRGLLLVIGLAIFGISCERIDGCINASGDRILTQRIESPFYVIDLRISATLNVEVDTSLTEPDIELIAQENLHENISIETLDGVLTIDFNDCIDQHEEVFINVKTPFLGSVIISGPGLIQTSEIIRQPEFTVVGNASGDCNILVDVDRLNVYSYGSGELTFSGYAQSSMIEINTSADYYGYDLLADTMDVFINASGNAQVRVENELNAFVNASGNIYYKGSPLINQTGTGSGRILEDN